MSGSDGRTNRWMPPHPPAGDSVAMDEQTKSTRYEFHVRGSMSDRLLSAFPDLDAEARNRETVLAGTLADQAALHGVIGRIESLGLELLEVRRVRPPRSARSASSGG